jgi:hypothetical protein
MEKSNKCLWEFLGLEHGSDGFWWRGWLGITKKAIELLFGGILLADSWFVDPPHDTVQMLNWHIDLYYRGILHVAQCGPDWRTQINDPHLA